MPALRRTVSRISRETRLLIATILVSAVVLLLLARLRFPEPPPTIDTATQPLERLAARASFEELATRVARLEQSIAPNLIVFRLSPRADPAPRRLDAAMAQLESMPRDVRHVPALRINSTTALAAIPPSLRISGIIGQVEASATASIAAADPVRHLARVRVPEGPSRPLPQLALASLQTPTYIVAVEGTQAGLTVRPVFLGRSERFNSPRWSRPLLPLGGAIVIPGALMFTLDGQFLGCVVLEDGMPAIAGATDILEAVERVEPLMRPVDAGIAVQALTPPISQATGAARGVVVAEVADGGPASGVLEAGDVIAAVDGQTIDDPEALLLRLGTRLASGAVQLTLARAGKPLQAELRAPPRIENDPKSAAMSPVQLESMARRGTRIRAVDARSSLALAGLTAGDVVVRAGAIRAPSPSQLRQEIGRTGAGEFLILVFRRGDTQRVTAVRGERGDVAAR